MLDKGLCCGLETHPGHATVSTKRAHVFPHHCRVPQEEGCYLGNRTRRIRIHVRIVSMEGVSSKSKDISTDGFPKGKSSLQYSKSVGSEVENVVSEKWSRPRLVKESAMTTSGEEANFASKVRAELSRLREVDPSTFGADITTGGALAR